MGSRVHGQDRQQERIYSSPLLLQYTFGLSGLQWALSDANVRLVPPCYSHCSPIPRERIGWDTNTSVTSWRPLHLKNIKKKGKSLESVSPSDRAN